MKTIQIKNSMKHKKRKENIFSGQYVAKKHRNSIILHTN